MGSNRQLKELARPFSRKYIQKAPKGKHGDYVSHSTVNERLLYAVGPFDFQLVEVVRGYAPEITTNRSTFPARENAIVGVVARLTVEVDGRRVMVEEVGAEDNPAMKNDGDNLKTCMSDALKRCAMRLGLGLHLWSGDLYSLNEALGDDDDADAPVDANVVARPTPGTARVAVDHGETWEVRDVPVEEADKITRSATQKAPPLALGQQSGVDTGPITPSQAKAIAAALKPLKLDKDEARMVVESILDRELPEGVMSMTSEEGARLAEFTTDQWAVAADSFRVPA